MLLNNRRAIWNYSIDRTFNVFLAAVFFSCNVNNAIFCLPLVSLFVKLFWISFREIGERKALPSGWEKKESQNIHITKSSWSSMLRVRCQDFAELVLSSSRYISLRGFSIFKKLFISSLAAQCSLGYSRVSENIRTRRMQRREEGGAVVFGKDQSLGEMELCWR